MCDAKTAVMRQNSGFVTASSMGVEAEHHHCQPMLRPGKCFSSAELSTPESEAIIINEEKLQDTSPISFVINEVPK